MRAHRTYQNIPVIVVAGKDVSEVAPKVRQHGVEYVIAKDDGVFPKLKALTALAAACECAGRVAAECAERQPVYARLLATAAAAGALVARATPC